MSERKRHYSGNHSKRFWTRVSKIKNDTEHASVYFAGVLLQELEERVLAHLEQAESLNLMRLRRAGEK